MYYYDRVRLRNYFKYRKQNAPFCRDNQETSDWQTESGTFVRTGLTKPDSLYWRTLNLHGETAVRW